MHTAFSRDARGLAYDPVSRDLDEKNIAPRYIDSLIVEQGQYICDLVMSKVCMPVDDDAPRLATQSLFRLPLTCLRVEARWHRRVPVRLRINRRL